MSYLIKLIVRIWKFNRVNKIITDLAWPEYSFYTGRGIESGSTCNTRSWSFIFLNIHIREVKFINLPEIKGWVTIPYGTVSYRDWFLIIYMYKNELWDVNESYKYIFCHIRTLNFTRHINLYVIYTWACSICHVNIL